MNILLNKVHEKRSIQKDLILLCIISLALNNTSFVCKCVWERGDGGGGSGGEVKVCMLTHIYAQNPTNPLRTINLHLLAGPWYKAHVQSGVLELLRVQWDLVHGTKYPYWDQMSLIRPSTGNQATSMNWMKVPSRTKSSPHWNLYL